MDWKEAEEEVAIKCEKLKTKLNLYTPEDIDVHYNEAEFMKELGVMKEAYSEVDESIRGLLRDYGDTIPTQIKEHLKGKVTETLQLMKSHERLLRAAVT